MRQDARADDLDVPDCDVSDIGPFRAVDAPYSDVKHTVVAMTFAEAALILR